MAFQRSFLQYFKLHSRRYDLNDNSSSLVQFTIHSASKHKKTWVRSSNGDILDQNEVPITGIVAQVDHPPLTSLTSYPLIAAMLLSIRDIDSLLRLAIIKKILSKAADIINMDSQVGSVWVVYVEIRIVTTISVDDGDLIDETTRGSDGIMVPANEPSIAALEQVMMVNTNTGDFSENCVICLEDFPMGSRVSRMPCSHVFHAKCIIKWLNESHCCPICRFEMPT